MYTLTDPTQIPVIGTGMTLGLTNGTANIGFTASATSAGGKFFPRVDAYGTPNSAATSTSTQAYGNFGVTPDPLYSGIAVDVSLLNTFSPYFYIKY